MSKRNGSLIKDWKLLPPGREKYQCYLASREWALLKEAVKARSGGRCERCGAPGTQVHHQTYERLYTEPLEDLLHVCGPCHEFLSARRKDDPVLSAPVFAFGRTIKNVYLAGKITNRIWRDEIAPGWSELNDGLGGPEEWTPSPRACKLPDGRCIDFSGPYWRCLHCCGGHCRSVNCGGVGINWIESPDGGSSEGEKLQCIHEYASPDDVKLRNKLIFQIQQSIESSDLLFAWIDTLDCFGSIYEIGFAAALDIPVVVASTPNFDTSDLWLSFHSANMRITSSMGPKDAWDSMWRFALLEPSEKFFFNRSDYPPPGSPFLKAFKS